VERKSISGEDALLTHEGRLAAAGAHRGCAQAAAVAGISSASLYNLSHSRAYLKDLI
jgi:hypothetical protein